MLGSVNSCLLLKLADCMTRFRYVSWHAKNKSWQVQRRGYPSPGSGFTTARAVAKVASKAFGIPLKSLCTGTYAKKPKESKYAFVYWHVRRRKWYAQANSAQGGATLGASIPKTRQLGH